ncbi:hypothetical protein BG011_003339 [Mortierella polycephala]|uniref:RING-type E3 ubiquitin transferase n=1 Tax=Mortierella polycephala TaxID=41804 RepID=A0A9P6Q2Y7_9FUNG|nr:hypothetical protein BG011_003339 [Mortierella polycephala]
MCAGNPTLQPVITKIQEQALELNEKHDPLSPLLDSSSQQDLTTTDSPKLNGMSNVELSHSQHGVSHGPMQDDFDSNHCVICLNACEDRSILETCQPQLNAQGRRFNHRFEPLHSTSQKASSSSSVSRSSSNQTYGIIRQLYGPPQRRRRFRNSQHTSVHESPDERSITEQQQQALERRRHIYRRRVFVKHIGANRISGFQQITPQTFKIFPHRLDRLIPWIRRELRAILSLSSDDNTKPVISGQHSATEDVRSYRYEEIDTGLEVIREYIIAVMKRYDLQTDQAQDLLRDFLHEHTEHFVHELMAFARSPHSIDAYDRTSQYNDVVVSGSSGTSSGIGTAERTIGNESVVGASLQRESRRRDQDGGDRSLANNSYRSGISTEKRGREMYGRDDSRSRERGSENGRGRSRNRRRSRSNDRSKERRKRRRRSGAGCRHETIDNGELLQAKLHCERSFPLNSLMVENKKGLEAILQAKLQRERDLYAARQGQETPKGA